MTFLSARRMALLVAATAALLAAVVLPSTAGAVTKPDLGILCSGSNIEGLGSTFQAPIDFIWSGYNWNKKENTGTGFNVASDKYSCEGTEEKNTKGQTIKTTGKPTIRWNQENAERGSGACLKDFGANGGTVRTNQFPLCGTDEAPGRSVEAQMEAHSASAEKESIESIPVLQGAVAVIVHLPKGCTASAEPIVKTKVKKIGRLALDQSVVEGIFRGTIKTWKEAVAAQGGHANDKLSCTGGAAEEEMRIHPVVRIDKSGTTHIFKEFLAQVNGAGFKAEKFNEINNGGKLEQPCKEPKEEEEKTWAQVGEGCENQRWPAAAEVTRNTKNEAGNPGVVNQVNEEESSIGYADLAVAREMKFFSSNTEGFEGGETKAGEKHQRFWAWVQQNPAGATPEYAEPSTLGDNAKLADSNCKSSVYIAKEGEVVPPPSTRDDWSQVKAAKESKTYPLCGLTYMLAYRAYFNYLNPIFGTSEEASKNIATTVENFLNFAVNSTAGGKEAAANHDYEKLPLNVKKIAETGYKEIGNKIA
jgi:ABC-type phosphate transport system substrate-binding protein